MLVTVSLISFVSCALNVVATSSSDSNSTRYMLPLVPRDFQVRQIIPIGGGLTFKRQDPGCPDGDYACTNIDGCCPVGADCLADGHCDITCGPTDPICADGCCRPGFLCDAAAQRCYPGGGSTSAPSPPPVSLSTTRTTPTSTSSLRPPTTSATVPSPRPNTATSLSIPTPATAIPTVIPTLKSSSGTRVGVPSSCLAPVALVWFLFHAWL